MNGPTPDILIQRLDRLERSARRLRIGGAVILAILALLTVLNLLLLVGTARSLVRIVGGGDSAQDDAGSEEGDVEEEVRARAFVLVDDDGNPRAVLAVRADGTPALAFSDQGGKVIWKAP